MSGFFNALVNADDSCGPVNPLAQLSKGLQGEGSQIGRVGLSMDATRVYRLTSIPL